ncbi:SCO2322 family protein [Streptomyces sp. MJP52]|uniref:SCO2322 family protein n=1 Tax=Streptomyces sp. MJP52 TaxID=2940555 RepID=UPI002474375B|nr:SCO2322 family protein [Streptomyces sp. MJP52]
MVGRRRRAGAGPGRRDRADPPEAPAVNRLRALVLAVLAPLTASLLLQGAGTAQAAGYRYWSYWELDGRQWVYATQGPASLRPEDGAVQGFRFSVSENSADAATPRATEPFAEICGGTPKRDGRKRIALVVDFGTVQDAPEGETPPKARAFCASVAEDASAADALAAVAAPLRYDSSALLCAVEGYPRTGCGEQVSVPDPSGGSSGGDASGDGAPGADAAAEDSAGDVSAGPSLGLWAGAGAVLLLGGAAVWQARRRRG